MPERSRSHAWPGLGLMIGLTALLVAYGGWRAVHRTARVDDAATGEEQRNPHGAPRWPDMRIDVNSAGASELSLLPGLGQKLAQRVVEDREALGPFASLDDLQRVSGMGAGTVDRLRPYAIASPSAGPIP